MKLAAFLCMVNCDVYLSNPRASNNRLNENSRNRANDNRLFDSQNNARGGTNIARYPIVYVKGQKVRLQYTQQHSCGTGNAKETRFFSFQAFLL